MELRVYLKVTSPFLRKLTALLYQFCDLRVFPPLKKFTSVPLSSDWLLVIFPLFLIGPRDQKPFYIFFRELTRVHTWSKPKGKQKWLSCNRSGCLLTLLPILFLFFYFYYYFFFTFQEVTWAKMWIRRKWPNSINRWPRWWTPGSSNKWVRVQCDQPEFFNKFLCMKTFLLQWNSLPQLHHSYTDNYAVVALSRIRHKWRWYTQGNEAFYWARRLLSQIFTGW